MNVFYRFLTVLPGLLSWGTLILLVFLSAAAPAAVAVFILVFDVYWFFRTLYLFIHLRTSFLKMKENEGIDWLKELQKSFSEEEWRKVFHLIIFPARKEPYEVLWDSFSILRKSNYPLDRFIVVLAVEAIADEETSAAAEKIQSEFGGLFFRFLITRHPAGLPNEIPGKGSNETWAVKNVKTLVIDPEKIAYENILVSVFDADTQIGKDYFGVLTRKFLSVPQRLQASYQPVPLFVNNILQAPAFARVIAFSTTFWQMMQQSRREELTTFSSHSMPFKALVEIGYWDTNFVSEDSHIFWQCYLHYSGAWRVEPLFYPVYMDANAAPSLWQTIRNLYKQQRRWSWGVENIPYLLSGFFQNKIIPFRRKWYWGFAMIEGFHSWATNSLIIFACGWLPLLLGGENFKTTLLAYNLPRYTSWIMTFANLFLASSAFFSILLLPRDKPLGFKWPKKIFYILQWFLTPITLILFGSIPALESQTRLMLGGRFRLGFWPTPKNR